jgi:rare lipoprotein A
MRGIALLALLTALAAPASSQAPMEGLASWYGEAFQGRLTSNGERFDKEKLTAAHRSLPFGTYVRVSNLDNGSSVVVRINDRGPFVDGRIIDLSEAAARLIGMIPTGTARVSVSILPPEEVLAWAGGPLEGAANPAGAGQGQAGPSAPAVAPGDAPAGGADAQETQVRIRIQVASYRDDTNARATVARLRAAGLDPSIERSGPYYRVVFVDLPPAMARRIASRLEILGYRGLVITESRPAARP